MIWIFDNQMSLEIEIGTVRTYRVVLFLKVKDAGREIQQDNEKTRTEISQAMQLLLFTHNNKSIDFLKKANALNIVEKVIFLLIQVQHVKIEC